MIIQRQVRPPRAALLPLFHARIMRPAPGPPPPRLPHDPCTSTPLKYFLRARSRSCKSASLRPTCRLNVCPPCASSALRSCVWPDEVVCDVDDVGDEAGASRSSRRRLRSDLDSRRRGSSRPASSCRAASCRGSSRRASSWRELSGAGADAGPHACQPYQEKDCEDCRQPRTIQMFQSPASPSSRRHFLALSTQWYHARTLRAAQTPSFVSRVSFACLSSLHSFTRTPPARP